MAATTEPDVSLLAQQARLQVKVERTVLRHRLIMMGNVLLVAFLFAALLMLIWIIVLAAGAASTMLPWASGIFSVPADVLLRLNVVGFIAFRFGAVLFLLCPGLAFRICGGAMQP